MHIKDANPFLLGLLAIGATALVGIGGSVFIITPLLSASHTNPQSSVSSQYAGDFPAGTRFIPAMSGVAVYCEKATGNLIYQSINNASIAVVKDGCPAS